VHQLTFPWKVYPSGSPSSAMVWGINQNQRDNIPAGRGAFFKLTGFAYSRHAPLFFPATLGGFQ